MNARSLPPGAPAWSRLPSEVALSLIRRAKLEDHTRLFFLAALHNRGDGHAVFDRGAIARGLDIDTKNVSHVIRRAVDAGLIEGISNARCVVLPGGISHGKETRHPWCIWHPTKPLRRTDGTAKTPLRRIHSTAKQGERRTESTAKEGIAAGQSVSPLLLTYATRDPHPEGV